MKKILLLAALVAFCGAAAQTIEKQTFVYSVKGADTLRLDRYQTPAPAAGTRPCLVFLFGGGFYTGARDQAAYVPFLEYYARRGYVVASIDYRLGMKSAAGGGQIDEKTFAPLFLGALAMATEDLYDATLHICDRAAEWGVDPARIVTSGSSAGAITVLMGEYGISNGSLLAQRLPAGFDYAGVIACAGAIFDMQDELEWKRTPAPILFFHGDADRNVPYDAVRYMGAGFFGSNYIARQFTERRIPHWFHSVANTGHSMAGDPLTDNRYEIDAFLEKMVLGREPLIVDTRVTPLDKAEEPKLFSLSDYVRANFPE